MLSGLIIRDIVLIEHLHLTFEGGLSVMTGETGAGKSILLDSLGLATGARADSTLVRHGADRGLVTACFDIAVSHPVYEKLHEHDIGHEDELILKRTITSNGKSKASINDHPVSVSLLKEVGDSLLEVHGQHDDRGLLDPKGHRALLDLYGCYDVLKSTVAASFDHFESVSKKLKLAEQNLKRAQEDEEYIRHAVDELRGMNVTAGEEERLAKERTRMMAGEKLAVDMNDMYAALTKDGGVDALVRKILRKLGRVDAATAEIMSPVTTVLDSAAENLNEAISELEELQRALDFEPQSLEATEERLFDLRALARKHKCQVDALPALLENFEKQLAAVEHGDDEVRALKAEQSKAHDAFASNVKALSAQRQKAAAALDKGVMAELPPLKLEKAKFKTDVELLDESAWGRGGGDKVSFLISTNPGAPLAPMIKIASGGELSRFILALKVVLAAKESASTMIFDEVDRGIGGATADAVGERLSRLSDGAQVLVVTHSPQVAAAGDAHYRIQKSDIPANGSAARTITAVERLDKASRREEIARMLAGAEVTDAAREAAMKLLGEG